MKKLKFDKKNVLVIAKSATILVGAVACGTAVGLAFKSLIPMENLGKVNKAMATIGVGLIGGVAGTACGNFAGDLFDAVITIPLIQIEEAVQAMKTQEAAKKVVIENP